MGHGDLLLLRQALEEKINAALNSTAVPGSQFDFHQLVEDVGCRQSPGVTRRYGAVELQTETVDGRLGASQLGLERCGFLPERLDLVGLSDEVDRFPAEISGGQQQRVAIARSLAKKPRLLLGDELTGNLDSTTSAMVMEVLVKACQTEGITCVFVTHDESLVEYSTRVVRLDSGKIVSDDPIG